MSFSYTPFSHLILVKDRLEEAGRSIFYWECDSCGADSNREGLNYCVTDELPVLWQSWVNHLINSHKLSLPKPGCDFAVNHGGRVIICTLDKNHDEDHSIKFRK